MVEREGCGRSGIGGGWPWMGDLAAAAYEDEKRKVQLREVG